MSRGHAALQGGIQEEGCTCSRGWMGDRNYGDDNGMNAKIEKGGFHR